MANSNEFDKFMEAFAEASKHTKLAEEMTFPIEVSGIKNYGPRNRKDRTGSWVSVRLASKTDTKTYLGIYLGDLILESFVSYNTATKEILVTPHTNPALYVPDLKRVVWGCESWWGEINTPEELRKITDADIENIWYVKALKELSVSEAEK